MHQDMCLHDLPARQLSCTHRALVCMSKSILPDQPRSIYIEIYCIHMNKVIVPAHAALHEALIPGVSIWLNSRQLVCILVLPKLDNVLKNNSGLENMNSLGHSQMCVDEINPAAEQSTNVHQMAEFTRAKLHSKKE